MLDYDVYLRTIAEELATGKKRTDTVRSLIGKFGYQRRGSYHESVIRQALNKYKLVTQPDFVSPYVDEQVEYQLEVDAVKKDERKPATVETNTALDPTYRIGRLEAASLEAAGKQLVYVAPNATLQEVITQMMANDFSQIPVLNGKQVKGIVSWKTIGHRLALGIQCATAQEAMETAKVVEDDLSIFQAIRDIVEHDYVLVQKVDKSISGIVTTSDLSLQFRLLTEPFLILSEIENHLRDLINSRFKPSELNAFKDPSDTSREITGASDLSFGEYQRLCESEDGWSKLGVKLDRKTFVTKLARVRIIRNDVMHFDPEGIEDKDLDALRSFVRFLQDLRKTGAINTKTG